MSNISKRITACILAACMTGMSVPMSAEMANSISLTAFAADETISENLTLSGDKTVSGDLTIPSGVTVDLAGYTLTVTGNLNVNGGTLHVSTGTLDVAGKFSVVSGGKFDMTSSKSVVKVGGDFYLWSNAVSTLHSGTMYVGGNFEGSKYGGEGGFDAYSTHTVIFTGDNVHDVYFNSENNYNQLNYVSMTGNGQLLLRNKTTGFTATSDLTFADGSVLAPGATLNANGHTLTAAGDFTLGGTVDLGNSTFNVKRDLNNSGGVLHVSTGTLNVAGKFSVASGGKFDMTSSKSVVKVGGDFYLWSNAVSTLHSGTMYVGGNFEGSKQSGEGGFDAYSTHTVIFTGDNVHDVYFNSENNYNQLNYVSMTGNGQLLLRNKTTGFTATSDLVFADGSVLAPGATLNANGHTLTAAGDFTLNGTVDLGNSTFNVKRDLNNSGGKLYVSTGTLNVAGKFSVVGDGMFDMTSTSSRAVVGGDFYLWSSAVSTLHSGILSVYGNFEASKYDGKGGYDAYSTHTTAFLDGNTHEVYINNSGGYNQINIFQLGVGDSIKFTNQLNAVANGTSIEVDPASLASVDGKTVTAKAEGKGTIKFIGDTSATQTLIVGNADTPAPFDGTIPEPKETDPTEPKTDPTEPTGSMEPSGQVKTDGHTYQRFEYGMSWTQAENYCESIGGHLVTITDSSEQSAVKSLLEFGDKLNYWIGGYKLSDDSLAWVTGETFDYSNFRSGEPNNAGGYREDRLMIYQSDGQWNDLQNSGEYPPDADNYNLDVIGFVCEWDSETVTPTNPGTTDPTEPTGTTQPGGYLKPDSKFTSNGHAYQRFDVGMTWFEAKAYCESVGGHLLTINSAEEQGLLETMLGMIVNQAGKDAYWIGGQTTNLTFSWVTGEDTSYTNWGTGQPDNYETDGGDCCFITRVAKFGIEANGWGDMSDTGEPFGLENIGFFCEWDNEGDVPETNVTEPTGEQGLANRNAYQRIQGESYDSVKGDAHAVGTDNPDAASSDGGVLGYVSAEDFAVFYNVDFEEGAPAKSVLFRYSNPSTENCSLNIYASKDGGDIYFIGNVLLPVTGAWYDYRLIMANLQEPMTGVQDIYLYFSTAGMNVDYFVFDRNGAVENPTEPPASTGNVMLGDVNLDGTIDIMDVIVINKFLLGSTTLGATAKINADVDVNGTIDTTDSLMILKYVVELIDSFGDPPVTPTEPPTTPTEPPTEPTSSENGEMTASIDYYFKNMPAWSCSYAGVLLTNFDAENSSAWIGIVPANVGIEEKDADQYDICYTYLRDADFIDTDYCYADLIIPKDAAPGDYQLRVYADDNGGALLDWVAVTISEANTVTFTEVGWSLSSSDETSAVIYFYFDYTGVVDSDCEAFFCLVPKDTPHTAKGVSDYVNTLDDSITPYGTMNKFEDAGGSYTAFGGEYCKTGEWQIRAYTDWWGDGVTGGRELACIDVPAYTG